MHTIFSTRPELLGHFFQIFTKPGSEIFFTLMTGWILCTARRTIEVNKQDIHRQRRPLEPDEVRRLLEATRAA